MPLYNPSVRRLSASDTTYTGTVRITGGPNVTVGTDASGVSISGPNIPAAQTGISGVAGSNTTYTSGTVELTGSNMVTVKSSANQRFVIDATQTAQTQSNIAGLAASNTTYNSGTVTITAGGGAITVSSNTGQRIDLSVPQTSSLSASTNITLSTTGSTIQFSGPRPDPLLYDWANFQQMDAVAMTHISAISKTPFYWSEEIPGGLTAKSFVFKMSNISTATLQSFSAHLGVYTFVNSTSMALLGSISESYNLSTASSASWSGIRLYAITGIGTHATLSTLTGGDYGFGMMFSGGATGSMNYSLFGAGSTGGPLGVLLPGANQASTGTSQGAQPLVGRGSSTVNAMPANVVASELINIGSGASQQLRPWIFIRS